MRQLRGIRIATYLVILTAIGASSCSYLHLPGKSNTNSNKAEGTQSPTVAITVGQSEERDIPSVLSATGSLIADETSDIAPKTAGKIANVSVNAGQFVKSGAEIARIDDHDARLQLAAGKAAVLQAQAGVRQALAKIGLLDGGKFEASTVPEVREANANYEELLAELKQAEANENRYRELLESGDISMVAYEGYRTTRDTARAKANSAKQALDAAVNAAKQNNQAISSAQAMVDAANNQVATAQQALKDIVIRAPYAGYISSRPTAVGEYVSTASIVATILRTNPIKAEIQIPEEDVPAAVPGHGVSIQVDAYKDRNFAGTVSDVNPAIDPTSRTATVEALVENNDNALRSGMFITASINREGGIKAVYVPKTAIFSDQTTQSYRAFVIVDGVAKLHVLQLGADEGDSQQILSGIDPNSTVATSNLDKLYDGAKVTF